ncbi:type II toxin-antitoxin system VapC family toxin [Rudanella lutea]|uniref:type II toxin-antitoxin system VapC family toxin n=1 Tax=Rudanella lutea TaxID=451374 RepID=UPI000381D2B2|nr:type II toxin-antitoxin system VapC family toxin [Rudanella lutea]
MEQSYLADTQIVIWSVINPSMIIPAVQTILQENVILVSEVSLLEIAIKQKIGRLPGLALSTDALADQLQSDGFHLLPIDRKHITAYDRIPLYGQHRDPFDRLLLATALVEGTPLISADEHFPLYSPFVRIIQA